MDATGPDAFLLLEVIGTIAFALSGGAVAVRAGMDWLGVIVLAVVTAVGGGTLRDLLLGQFPVWWIEDPWLIAIAAATGVVVIVLAHRLPDAALDSPRSFLVADALGLAAFTVTGTLMSMAAGVPGWAAVLLGVVTGAGGGVIRDVLARQMPLILVGQIYALAALAGAIVVVLLTDVGVPDAVTRWIGVVLILAIRLLAIRFSWGLPRFARASE
jgi:uncharacterized membrane protein YeiH